jgi:hypothetical protein
MAKALTCGGLALPALVALVLGPGPFAVVLTLVAVVALIDLTGVLSRAAARPILPAALIPAVGLPVTVGFRPDLGWDLVPPFVAGGFLITFLFALLFGRRRGIVQGAGTTVLAGLIVGLGAASLVLLRGLPGGFRWVLAFGLIAAAADLGGPLSSALRARRGADAQPGGGLAAPVVGAVVVAAALLLALRPTLSLPVTALLTLIALTAALGGADLHRGLVAEADLEAPLDRPRLGDGVVFGLLDGVLIGAPIAYILARSAVL